MNRIPNLDPQSGSCYEGGWVIVRRAYAGNAERPDVHLTLVLSLVHGKNHLHNNNNNALLFLKNT
jgi:hypothetical protein